MYVAPLKVRTLGAGAGAAVGGSGGIRSCVLLPKTNAVAPGARENGVPETVTDEPPAISGVSLMM